MKIRLSQRNLLSLLHKLEMPGSVRTIIKATDDGEEVLIEAVTDEECYAGRDPGPMHPETEIFVSLLARALKIVRRQIEGEPPNEPTQAHELRAKSLGMLRSQMASLKRMVQAEAIDDLPAAMMAVHYALMELNLETAVKTGELPDPIQVLHDLFEAGDLEDHFYAVREREGQGWEGPRMKRWGQACDEAWQLLRGYVPCPTSTKPSVPKSSSDSTT